MATPIGAGFCLVYPSKPMLDIRSLKGKLSFANTFLGTLATEKVTLFESLIVKSGTGFKFTSPTVTTGTIANISLFATKLFCQ